MILAILESQYWCTNLIPAFSVTSSNRSSDPAAIDGVTAKAGTVDWGILWLDLNATRLTKIPVSTKARLKNKTSAPVRPKPCKLLIKRNCGENHTFIFPWQRSTRRVNTGELDPDRISLEIKSNA